MRPCPTVARARINPTCCATPHCVHVAAYYHADARNTTQHTDTRPSDIGHRDFARGSRTHRNAHHASIGGAAATTLTAYVHAAREEAAAPSAATPPPCCVRAHMNHAAFAHNPTDKTTGARLAGVACRTRHAAQPSRKPRLLIAPAARRCRALTPCLLHSRHHARGAHCTHVRATAVSGELANATTATAGTWILQNAQPARICKAVRDSRHARGRPRVHGRRSTRRGAPPAGGHV